MFPLYYMHSGVLVVETDYVWCTYPTMVPTPTSVSTATPATEVNSSGAEDPAAMNVAPATSSDK